MTRQTDASIARAFDRALLNFDVSTPWSVVYRRMKEWATEFDAESPAGPRMPTEAEEATMHEAAKAWSDVPDAAAWQREIRGTDPLPEGHRFTAAISPSIQRVQTPPEPERGYCPLCRGNVWVGRSCNGPNCPLRK